jgi:hypothetical protein
VVIFTSGGPEDTRIAAEANSDGQGACLGGAENIVISELFPDVDRVPQIRCLPPMELRPSFSTAKTMVGYLRDADAKNLGDPHWEEFIVELCSESPNFKALWACNDVAVPVSRTKQSVPSTACRCSGYALCRLATETRRRCGRKKGTMTKPSPVDRGSPVRSFIRWPIARNPFVRRHFGGQHRRCRSAAPATERLGDGLESVDRFGGLACERLPTVILTSIPQYLDSG